MPCYVIFCVDSSESELGVLDLTQVSGETLDRCFENVCEPDLIFHAEFTVLMVMEDAVRDLRERDCYTERAGEV